MVEGFPVAPEVAEANEGVDVFTLLVFHSQFAMWSSLAVSERREVLDRLAVELRDLAVPCEVRECVVGLGVDGGDIAVIGKMPPIPEDGDVCPGAYLE